VRGRPRPHAATRIVDRLKLHRRRLRLDRRDYTVVTLRPGTVARYSTNYFHATWHIVSDWHGARLLARLLWGLAYQRTPHLLVVIDRPFLDPNPFDGEPADPVALVPMTTPWGPKAARDLRRRLPRAGDPDGTVLWRTHGLPAAAGERRPLWTYPVRDRLRVDRVGGLVTLAADPPALRDTACAIHRLGEYSYQGMSYVDLDDWNGEVQVFRDYARRVSAARVARREVLAGTSDPLPPDSLRPLIWRRTMEIRHRPRRRAATAA